jgi:hypothetical protein
MGTNSCGLWKEIKLGTEARTAYKGLLQAGLTQCSVTSRFAVQLQFQRDGTQVSISK